MSNLDLYTVAAIVFAAVLTLVAVPRVRFDDEGD